MAGHNLNEFYFLHQEEIVASLGKEMKTLDARELDLCAISSKN